MKGDGKVRGVRISGKGERNGRVCRGIEVTDDAKG